MGQRFFIALLTEVRVTGCEIDQIERLVHNFCWQLKLLNDLRVVGPFACSAPVFWRNGHGDAWIKFFLADFPSPDDKLCIEPLPDDPSALVRCCETVPLIESFATGEDFDVLARSFLLQFGIELVDQIALQRITRVVTH